MTVNTLAGGRYALSRRVGAGGMAEVFLARDTRLERDVAIKVFRPGTADGIERGSVEARLLAGLDHPGLVRVLDMDTGHGSGDGAYLVMEYISGPDLGVVLRGGPLSPAAVRHVGFDLARALHHIHHRGVIHRDIKPSNILTRDADPDSGVFTYLLTDFGIARFFDGSGMTATGQVIGSAAYFSPEQARGAVVGTPTDIYSLGLVLIECLAGERAFPGTGVESALARLHRSPSIPASAGPALTELLAAMTLDDPAARPDARAVATAFADLGAGPGAAAPSADALAGSEPTRAMPAPGEVFSGASGGTAPTAEVPAAVPRTEGMPTAALPEAEGMPTAALPRAGAPTTALPAADPGHRPEGEAATTGSPEQAGRALPLSAEPRQRPTGARGGAEPRPRRKFPGWLAAIAALLLAVGVFAGVVLIQGADPGADPEPLPPVPGVTGEKLEELYESVNP